MKFKIAATALMAVAGTASAQSTVTLYGIVDTNFTYQKGATSVKSLSNGGWNGSRWGMRGTEDLGGGLKAVFNLEAGVNTDDGTSAQGGRAFGRRSIVGIEGGFGAIKLGRTLTPTGVLADESKTLGTKPADLQVAARMLPATEFYRTDNAITYESPNFNGLTASAQYSFGYNGAEVASGVGKNAGFNVIYKGGPLQAGVGYLKLRASATGADIKSTQANAGWDFGPAAVKGIYVSDDYGTAKNRVLYGAEVSVPVGNFVGSVGIGKLRDSTGLANVDDNASLYTVQLGYWLSKRTALYALYTHVSNPGSGATPLATVLAGTSAARPGWARSTSGPGEASSQMQVGLRHAF